MRLSKRRARETKNREKEKKKKRERERKREIEARKQMKRERTSCGGKEIDVPAYIYIAYCASMRAREEAIRPESEHVASE